MATCKDCNATYILGTLFCEECGRFLLAQAESSESTLIMSSISDELHPTDSLGIPPVSEVNADHLTFFIANSGRRLTLDLEKKIDIGRFDPGHGVAPEVDLTQDRGAEYGVSRRHATIRSSDDGIMLVDLGSTNGTRINNRRLRPKTPQPIQHGDEIRFGRLLVQVFFESSLKTIL